MTVNKFKNNRYVLVKDALNSDIVNVITNYALFDEKQNFSGGDKQVPNAHSRYADPAMESILLYLKPIMEENTGLELEPTYSFYRVYRQDDELVPHKDRESCEISCTVSFNYSYNADEYTWPIFMEGESCVLTPGDLVVYRGCELEHWRDKFHPPSSADWHVQGFFHYVDKNGPYIDWKYDKRSCVGEKKNNKKSYVIYTGI